MRIGPGGHQLRRDFATFVEHGYVERRPAVELGSVNISAGRDDLLDHADVTGFGGEVKRCAEIILMRIDVRPAPISKATVVLWPSAAAWRSGVMPPHILASIFAPRSNSSLAASVWRAAAAP